MGTLGLGIALFSIPAFIAIWALLVGGVETIIQRDLPFLSAMVGGFTALAIAITIAAKRQDKSKKQKQPKWESPKPSDHYSTNYNRPTLPAGFQTDYGPRPTPLTENPIETSLSSFQQSKPEELYEMAQLQAKAGGRAVSEELLSEAKMKVLKEVKAGKRSMGSGLRTLEQFEKQRQKVHEERLQPSPPPPPEPSEEEEATIDFEKLVVTDPGSWEFDKIMGNEPAKKALREALVFPILRRDLIRVQFPRAVLMFGPPGCGKTILAKAVANELKKLVGKSYYLEVDAPNIMSKWLGTAERNVEKLFDDARKHASDGTPVIIFMDELDDLLPSESTHEFSEKVRNQFQRELTDIENRKDVPVYLIGATNKPWKLNDAMVRRLKKRILVDLPQYDDKIQLFKTYFNELLPTYEFDEDVNFNELAASDLTKNYSGDDILQIASDLQSMMMHEMYEKGKLKTGKPRKITMQDCKNAVTKRRPAVDEGYLDRQRKWYESLGAA